MTAEPLTNEEIKKNLLSQLRDAMFAKISQSPAGSHWRHEARQSTCRVVGPVNLQIEVDGPLPEDGETFVLYQDDETGLYFARDPDRFVDLGRFAELPFDRPHIDHFLSAVSIEADHQKLRWGEAHDRSKSAENWHWLVGYLASKALFSTFKGDTRTALHHCVSAAAALMQWFDAIKRDASGSGRGEDADLAPPSSGLIDIVFDGPPGSDGPRFVEVENENGRSLSFGKWIKRDDGYWVIRFDPKNLT